MKQHPKKELIRALPAKQSPLLFISKLAWKPCRRSLHRVITLGQKHM